ncbi:MAG: zinc-ribbon domain containing protein [Dehalococcoidia bacterium]
MLVCRDCGDNFIFTTGEQEFFQQRGLQNEPRRCPGCRRARKMERDGGGGGHYRETFTITCAECGQEDQVPFQPRQGRPVYCSGCFEKQRSAEFS